MLAQNRKVEKEMDNQKLTVQQIINKVREIAERLPDYVYQKPTQETKCEYKPSIFNPYGCIFGLAFRELGVPVDHIGGSIVSNVINSLMEKGKVEGEHIWQEMVGEELKPEVKWCDTVQAYQDGRKGPGFEPPRYTWWDAVKKADEEVKLLA